VSKQLRRDGVDVARCTVERLMGTEGRTGAVARRRRPRTTIPGYKSHRPRDLVGRDVLRPRQLCVTDITHVELTGGGFCYTAFVTDVFSRAIVGWQVLDTLKTELALDTLGLARCGIGATMVTGVITTRPSAMANDSPTPELNVPSAVKVISTITRGGVSQHSL
jgi:hypothetical protein